MVAAGGKSALAACVTFCYGGGYIFLAPIYVLNSGLPLCFLYRFKE